MTEYEAIVLPERRGGADRVPADAAEYPRPVGLLSELPFAGGLVFRAGRI
jgi:hypothetical protein